MASYTERMFATRQATLADAALIAQHRYAMFAEMNNSDLAALDLMRANFVPWVQRMLTCGKYVGWIVEDGGRAVASAGFFELEWPPHRLDPAGEHRGYLLNFWVEPAFRGRGLARELVKEALAESRRRGIRVTALHASDAGRRVYEPMGFKTTNEMYFVDEDR
jgi:ribosomal protein S18 acetylase RimI-like enzyme